MLKTLFPYMYDSPEKEQAISGFCYALVPFVLMPSILTLLVIDTSEPGPRMVLECIYLIANFFFLLSIFRTYLADSWLNVTVYPKKFWSVCIGAAALITAIYGGVTCAAFLNLFDKAGTAALGILPMEGLELLLLPGDFVLFGGIIAVVIAVVLGPVITACLYYATVFAPLCAAGHRIWAYLAVAAMTAAPRILTSLTFWGGWKEKELFLFQLPIHWIACWAYQKTDTIWAPIFIHAIANALSCGILFALQAIGYIS